MNFQEYKKCLNEVRESDLLKLKQLINVHQDIVILGNGGSSAIASHRALDYTNALGKQARTLDSTAMMSCYANDFGWSQTFKLFLERNSDSDTLVILISSSGNSENILNCAQYCVERDLTMITLSGFSVSNKLITEYADKSALSFHVNSSDYGVVECLHDVILHSVV